MTWLPVERMPLRRERTAGLAKWQTRRGRVHQIVTVAPMGRGRTYTDEPFVEAVRCSRSYGAVLSRLGLVPAGGNDATLRATIQRLDLDVAHMLGAGWSKGGHLPDASRTVPFREILVENSAYQSHKLKNRLLRDKVLERACARCGNAEWLSGPIPLELDHRNGLRTDHRLENLRLLCPNCHALTASYRGRNIGKHRHEPAGVVERHTRSS